jgi:hypothetical protein
MKDSELKRLERLERIVSGLAGEGFLAGSHVGHREQYRQDVQDLKEEIQNHA